ncbi:metal ABC transporter solute-binding protein, Zn/Mn family [Thermodesulfobacteriota bacterium]
MIGNCIRLLLGYIMVASLLVGLPANCHIARAGEEKPVILCSTTQIADFTRQVVGDDCEVLCVLAPGADPHTYMPTPGDAKLALKADLCLENGLHLEGKSWMATLAKDAGKPLVTCTRGVKPIQLEEEGKKITDPHAWFDPRNAAIYVNNIVRAVEKLDAGKAERYRSRAKLYLQQLRALYGWVSEQFNVISPERRILVTSHDAFNYFAKAFGFRNRAPVGWSTGSEVGAGMTPERFKQVVESIRKFGVKAVFVETSVNPKLVREIAREAGVKIGGELYSDSMGEAGSAGETYIGMTRENVLTITGALK